MKSNEELTESIYKKIDDAAKHRKHVIFTGGSAALSLILITGGIFAYHYFNRDTPTIIQNNSLTMYRSGTGSTGTHAQSSPPQSPQPSADLNQSGTTSGLPVFYPSITFNNIDYTIAGGKGLTAVTAADPPKFVGSYLGSLNGFFVFTGEPGRPLETAKLYSVIGMDKNFMICADTSAGWEFFIRSRPYQFDSSGAKWYGEKGYNFKNLFESASYYLDSINSASINFPSLPSGQPLGLSASVMDEFFDYLCTQPLVELPSYAGKPDGASGCGYRINIKLSNTMSIPLFLEEPTHYGVSLESADGVYTPLKDPLKSIFVEACKNEGPGAITVPPTGTPVPQILSPRESIVQEDDIQCRGCGF